MSNFIFNEAIEKAAETVRRTTRCAEHGNSPTYEIEKTTKGSNVEWSFCCDALKEQVEKKFKAETTKHAGDAAAKSLADIFKKK